MTCVPFGFGTGPWGTEPWGGSTALDAGGPLPTVPPFDVYCVGPCGPIASILSHTEVSTVGNGLQFPIAGNMDQLIGSGGSYPTTDAALYISTNVPEDWTLEFTVEWNQLPTDFSNLVQEHAFVGVSSAADGCAGLFFSQVGIAYTGCVHLDASDDLVLDTPVQLLPNSQLLVDTTEFWTIRLAMSFSTGAVYVYVTQTDELLSIGHQLRYVLPALPSSGAAVVPPSQTLISVRGAAGAEVEISLNSICLGTGLIIPALQPSSNAGLDQTILLCSILQLDASKSFDPEGGSLTYAWRLIDAPLGSQYIFDGADGRTYPLSPPTGFTNRFYSSSLGVLNGTTPIQVGDVLVVAGDPYNIQGTGSDGDGFFVRIDGYDLPDSLSSNTTFKYLPQNGLNTPTSEKPTFYPDIAGFFKFDLTVYNGSVFSEPSTIVVNVTESPVARGCVPDLTFLWNYLSDFWQLVENKERIEVFWQGMAQVAGAELLNLWQADYSKSLRDIQRTFQRKWLHYDLLMQEDSLLLDATTAVAVYSGIESVDIPNAGLSGISGTHLDLQLATVAAPVVISFFTPDPFTATQLQSFIQAALAQVTSSVTVQLIANHAGTASRIRIDAPFPIAVNSTSTATFMSVGQMNGAPTGTAGAAVGVQTYRVDRSMQFLNIPSGSFLCIDGVAYRITSVVDNASDPYPFMRVTLADALPSPADTTWSIAGTATSPDLNFYSGMVEVGDTATFEVIRTSDSAVVYFSTTVLGACAAAPQSLPVDATPIGLYLFQSSVYTVSLYSILRRKYIPIDPLLVDVPYLQELIVSTDDTQVLRRNVDYFFDTFRGNPCIRFVTPTPLDDPDGPDVWNGADPPARMWAEYSYLDNRPTIEANFGIPAEFTLDDLSQLPSNVDYLSAVTGLWYAYFNGPTLFNLRAGVQILLGLPFADTAGTIIEIRADFSSQQGRILIQDANDTAIVRSYMFPASLPMETNPATNAPYAVGDTVAQFAPLVTGVEIDDYVKNPTWFQGYLQQGAFFEVEKFFKFLVRVDSSAFNLSALLFVQSFILRIKPTYTYPLFVVLEQLGTTGDTTVSTSDEIDVSGTLSLYDGACFDDSYGVSTMFDQPHAAGGGWRNQFDASPLVPPTYNTPTLPILWAYDKNYLCPEDIIIGTACTTFVSSTYSTFDSLFQFDLPVFTSDVATLETGHIYDIPTASLGLQIGGPLTLGASGTIDTVEIEIVNSLTGTPATYLVTVQKNGTTVGTASITVTPTAFITTVAMGFSVVSGDVLTAFIHSTAVGPSTIPVDWDSIFLGFGQSVTWAFDTTLPAGTYCAFYEL